MTFNMGVGGVMKFENMLQALQMGDFDTASTEVLRSRYANQVGNRSATIAKLIKFGDKSNIIEQSNDAILAAQVRQEEQGVLSNIIGQNIVWPPADGRFTSPFGPRGAVPGVPGASRNHKGIDIGPPIAGTIGSPIRSVMGGKIIKSGPGSGYGNVIYIQHPDGSETRYAHLANMRVSEGDTVQAGQVIGAMGATGLKGMKPHLHFEIRKNNIPLNPESVFGKLATPGTQMNAGTLSSSPDASILASLPKGKDVREQGGGLEPVQQLTSSNALSSLHSNLREADYKINSSMDEAVMDKFASRIEGASSKTSSRLAKNIVVAMNNVTNVIANSTQSSNNVSNGNNQSRGRDITDDISDILLGPGRGSGSYI
jgi:murein DD-endopeptidase MepM/ murein hydrolase activator NlpD